MDPFFELVAAGLTKVAGGGRTAEPDPVLLTIFEETENIVQRYERVQWLYATWELVYRWLGNIMEPSRCRPCRSKKPRHDWLRIDVKV